MKTRVVLFHPDKAEVLVNPEPAQYIAHPNYLVNPDTSAVAGLPPHRWTRVGDQVCPTTEQETTRREVVLTKDPLTPKTVYRHIPMWHHGIVIAISVLIAYAMRYIQ